MCNIISNRGWLYWDNSIRFFLHCVSVLKSVQTSMLALHYLAIIMYKLRIYCYLGTILDYLCPKYSHSVKCYATISYYDYFESDEDRMLYTELDKIVSLVAHGITCIILCCYIEFADLNQISILIYNLILSIEWSICVTMILQTWYIYM